LEKQAPNLPVHALGAELARLTFEVLEGVSGGDALAVGLSLASIVQCGATTDRVPVRPPQAFALHPELFALAHAVAGYHALAGFTNVIFGEPKFTSAGMLGLRNQYPLGH
jgi:hypothetical protein